MRKKAWQRLLREKVSEQLNETTEDKAKQIRIEPEFAEVKVITNELAKTIILQYEWLKTMPPAAFLSTGLFIDGELAGVEVFVSAKAGGHYTYLKEQATVLARGACVHWAPKWANSYLVSKSLKILRDYYEGEPRYVLAYSDWEAGELGTIYQATNWTYTGHRKVPEWRDKNGKRYDQNRHRDLAKKYDKDYKKTKKLNKKYVDMVYQQLLDKGFYRSHTYRGRYVYVIGYKGKEKSRLLKKLNTVKKPYPKSNIK